MQLKLFTAVIASLALSGVLAAPQNIEAAIEARDVNQANQELQQLGDLAIADKESTQKVFEKLGATFNQLAAEFDSNPNAEVPTEADIEDLKKQLDALKQQQKRDAEAEPQSWWGWNNYRVNYINRYIIPNNIEWRFQPGFQRRFGFVQNPGLWDYSLINYYTAFGLYNTNFQLQNRIYWGAYF